MIFKFLNILIINSLGREEVFVLRLSFASTVVFCNKNIVITEGKHYEIRSYLANTNNSLLIRTIIWLTVSQLWFWSVTNCSYQPKDGFSIIGKYQSNRGSDHFQVTGYSEIMVLNDDELLLSTKKVVLMITSLII